MKRAGGPKEACGLRAKRRQALDFLSNRPIMQGLDAQRFSTEELDLLQSILSDTNNGVGAARSSEARGSTNPIGGLLRSPSDEAVGHTPVPDRTATLQPPNATHAGQPYSYQQTGGGSSGATAVLASTRPPPTREGANTPHASMVPQSRCCSGGSGFLGTDACAGDGGAFLAEYTDMFLRSIDNASPGPGGLMRWGGYGGAGADGGAGTSLGNAPGTSSEMYSAGCPFQSTRVDAGNSYSTVPLQGGSSVMSDGPVGGGSRLASLPASVTNSQEGPSTGACGAGGAAEDEGAGPGTEVGNAAAEGRRRERVLAALRDRPLMAGLDPGSFSTAELSMLRSILATPACADRPAVGTLGHGGAGASAAGYGGRSAAALGGLSPLALAPAAAGGLARLGPRPAAAAAAAGKP